MKTAAVVLGAAGLVALVAGLVTVAQVHGGHAGHGPHGAQGPMAVTHMVAWLVDNTLDGVGASETQRARVLAVRDRVMSAANVLHTGHDATHEVFRRQWELDTMDSRVLHDLVDDRLEELRRVLHTSVDGVVEVHDTLTPEQRQALTARIQAMHGTK
jgi:hypothetical protein